MMAPTFTTQERSVLRELWAIVGTFDHRRRLASAIERELTTCQDDRQRAALLRDLFAARQAENGAILDLRDGTYHLCQTVGAAPWDWAGDEPE